MNSSSFPEIKILNFKLSDIRISRALFSFILACFLLPFITVSCGTEQFSLNGLQVVGGADLDHSTAGNEVDADLGVATTVLLALTGLVLSYFGIRYLSLGIIGLVGSLLLWTYQLRLNASVTNTNGRSDAVISAIVGVRYELGYWLVLLLFLLAAGLNGYLFWQARAFSQVAKDTEFENQAPLLDQQVSEAHKAPEGVSPLDS